MSRYSIDTTTLGLDIYIILTYSVIRLRAIDIDLPSLAPIYTPSRSPLYSISLDILLATITSSALVSVFSRAIGLYTLGLE